MKIYVNHQDSEHDIEIRSDQLIRRLFDGLLAPAKGDEVDEPQGEPDEYFRLGIALDIEEKSRELEEVRANNKIHEDTIISEILMLTAKYRRDA